MNPETQGEPSVRRKYEVTTNQVGKTLTWTISNRESGMAIDLWLFSTNPDLMDQYTQEELDQLLLNPVPTRPATQNSPSALPERTRSCPGRRQPPALFWNLPALFRRPIGPSTRPHPVVVGDQNTVTVDACKWNQVLSAEEALTTRPEFTRRKAIRRRSVAHPEATAQEIF